MDFAHQPQYLTQYRGLLLHCTESVHCRNESAASVAGRRPEHSGDHAASLFPCRAECNWVISCSRAMASITASKQIHAGTQIGPVTDMIRLVHQCNVPWNELGTELGTRCPTLRFNNQGQATPCADACTLVETVWALPGTAAREIRRASTEIEAAAAGMLRFCYKHTSSYSRLLERWS